MPRFDRIYLVSCVAQKQSRPAPAKELYISDWFRKARQYVEQSGAPWFILSAEYGLVHPDAELAPYNVGLTAMTAADRRAWAGRVREQMDKELPPAEGVIILAGRHYREYLVRYLTERFGAVSIPMEGLGIGEQKQWLGQAIAGNDAAR